MLTNLREAGKSVIVLDAEAEYEDLARNPGGTYLEFMSGQYRINPLEPKAWNVDADAVEDAPEAFQKNNQTQTAYLLSEGFFQSLQEFFGQRD